MKPQRRGLIRIIFAFGYSLQGFRAAYSHEAAFRQELMMLVILVPTAIWLSVKPIHLMAMLGSLLLVLIVELLNSALEAAVDRVGAEVHLLSGQAKDMGSAAVFLSILNVFLMWGLVLYDLYFYS